MFGEVTELIYCIYSAADWLTHSVYCLCCDRRVKPACSNLRGNTAFLVEVTLFWRFFINMVQLTRILKSYSLFIYVDKFSSQRKTRKRILNCVRLMWKVTLCNQLQFVRYIPWNREWSLPDHLNGCTFSPY